MRFTTMCCTRDFFSRETLLQSANHTWITVLPKKPTASELADFRPISCVNVVYKLITKILVRRMLEVAVQIESNNQTAFMTERNISNNTLLADEMLHGVGTIRTPRSCVVTSKCEPEKSFWLNWMGGYPWDWKLWASLDGDGWEAPQTYHWHNDHHAQACIHAYCVLELRDSSEDISIQQKSILSSGRHAFNQSIFWSEARVGTARSVWEQMLPFLSLLTERISSKKNLPYMCFLDIPNPRSVTHAIIQLSGAFTLPKMLGWWNMTFLSIYCYLRTLVQVLLPAILGFDAGSSTAWGG